VNIKQEERRILIYFINRKDVMDLLLLAFALPVATIILAIVLQKILRCPLLVAATFFAVFLIVTFTAFDSSFLVLAILYTILAYVTAVLTRLICNIISRWNLNCGCRSNCICNQNDNTYNVASNETWCCTSRNSETNVTRTGVNTTSENNSCGCSNNNLNVANNVSSNEPVIILTNGNQIRNLQRRNNSCCCRR